MKSQWLFLVGLSAGCATGGEDNGVVAADASVDSAIVSDTSADSQRPPYDGPMDAIFTVEDTAPPAPPKICNTPMGTTATASGAYMTTPEMAIDREFGTLWNAGDHLGWLRLKFPAPITFDRVQLAAHGAPDCNVTYTISAAAKIGDGTRAVTGTAAWLDPIPVTAGTYDEILIDAAYAESWITLHEVRVFDSTGACP